MSPRSLNGALWITAGRLRSLSSNSVVVQLNRDFVAAQAAEYGRLYERPHKKSSLHFSGYSFISPNRSKEILCGAVNSNPFGPAYEKRRIGVTVQHTGKLPWPSAVPFRCFDLKRIFVLEGPLLPPCPSRKSGRMFHLTDPRVRLGKLWRPAFAYRG